MTLPGVIVSNREKRHDDEPLWEFIEATIRKTIDNLNEMRAAEGANMAATLHTECEQVRQRVDRDRRTGSASGRYLSRSAGNENSPRTGRKRSGGPTGRSAS